MSRKKQDKKPKTKEAERQIFISFSALPKQFRQKEYGFDSDADFGKKYQVNKNTLTDWKKEPKFLDEMRRLRRHWGWERTPNVIFGLYRKILAEGGAAEVRLWMQIFEGFDEKTEQNAESEELRELTEVIKKALEYRQP